MVQTPVHNVLCIPCLFPCTNRISYLPVQNACYLENQTSRYLTVTCPITGDSMNRTSDGLNISAYEFSNTQTRQLPNT